MIRRFLFGRDEDQYFDMIRWGFFTMAEYSLWERFVYRSWKPIIRVWAWMQEWDYRFAMRYYEIKKRQNPLDYIQ